MQRDHRFYADKQLLALNREFRALQKQCTVRVPIDPPIQRGWVRRWRLAKVAQSRPDAAVLLTILSGINTEVHFWRRNFKPGKGRKDRFRRHILTGQALRVLHEWDWRRLGWPVAWRHRYFRSHETLSWSKQKVTILTFRLEGIYELYTDRHYLFDLPVLNSAAESRTAEIESAVRRIGEFRLERLMDSRRAHWPGADLRQCELRQIHVSIIRNALRGEDVEVKGRFFRSFISASLRGMHFTRGRQLRRRLPDFHSGNAGANPAALATLFITRSHRLTA